MTKTERHSIITLGNRDMAESKTFNQMAAVRFKSLLEQNIHHSLLNKTTARTLMYPHYAGIHGQVGSGKTQAHTQNRGTAGEGWVDAAFMDDGFASNVLPTSALPKSCSLPHT